MIQTLPEVVALHPLFAGLPGDIADIVSGGASNVAFGAGRLLVTEGELADTLYLIRHGTVDLEVLRAVGAPLVIERLGPGAPLGWSWLFPPYRWHLDARAATPVRAIAIDAACLREHCDNDPAFGYELMRRVSAVLLERLQATRFRLVDAVRDSRSVGSSS